MINRCQAILAFLAIFNLVDALSTHIMVQTFHFSRELNPLMFLVIEYSGLQGFWLVKAGISAGLLYGVRLLSASSARYVYSAALVQLCVLSLVIGFNVSQIILATMLGL